MPSTPKQQNAFSKLVKDNYNSVRDKPTKYRFRILSEMWKTEKLKQTNSEIQNSRKVLNSSKLLNKKIEFFNKMIIFF